MRAEMVRSAAGCQRDKRNGLTNIAIDGEFDVGIIRPHDRVDPACDIVNKKPKA